MSDKKKALLDAEQKRLITAQAEFAMKSKIIRNLPDELPAPSRLFLTGFCADASLYFEAGAFEEALKAYPALPCNFIEGDTVSVKPIAYLRDSDRGRRRVIYPVVYAQNKVGSEVRAFWWSKQDGITLEININGVGMDDIHNSIGDHADRFEKGGYSYSTGHTGFWKLARKTEADFKLVSPMEAWQNESYAIAHTKGWDSSEGKLRFLRTIIETTMWSQEFTLPAKDMPKSPWGNMGDFWRFFTDAEASDIMLFVEARKEALKDVYPVIEAMMERAEKWFIAFFAARGKPFKPGADGLSAEGNDAFRYLFRKETGIPGTIHWVQPSKHGVQVGFTLDKAHIRVQCEYQHDAPAIDWDALTEYR